MALNGLHDLCVTSKRALVDLQTDPLATRGHDDGALFVSIWPLFLALGVTTSDNGNYR